MRALRLICLIKWQTEKPANYSFNVKRHEQQQVLS